MTSKELADQRIRCNRAVRIEQERQRIADALAWLKQTHHSDEPIVLQLPAGPDVAIPLGQISDVLVDRLVAYDKKLADDFTSL
jgi:hypothetical protein